MNVSACSRRELSERTTSAQGSAIVEGESQRTEQDAQGIASPHARDVVVWNGRRGFLRHERIGQRGFERLRWVSRITRASSRRASYDRSVTGRDQPGSDVSARRTAELRTGSKHTGETCASVRYKWHAGGNTDRPSCDSQRLTASSRTHINARGPSSLRILRPQSKMPL